MNNKEITFEKAITYKKERCDVVHKNTTDFSEIPDHQIEKAHGVCIHNNKILLVLHPEWNIWSIPGGGRDEGETITETLKREVLEETNCKVLSWQPIAYQKIAASTGDLYYRALYVCDVIPEGDFVKDVAGNITEIKWVGFDEYENYIENKPFKLEVVREALRKYKKKATDNAVTTQDLAA
ncbi:NUDIX hydrolase [Candidatus Pacebacteria bacterium]|nr:NUDIX hydrolase [Candidatus Paceibacterota bacterium]